jgi:hypothetical protein
MFWKIPPRIPSICPCLLVSPFSWLAQEINLQCLMVNTCPFPWKLGAVRGWVSHHSYRAYTPTDGSCNHGYTWFQPLWSIFAATIHHYQPLWTIVLTHDIPMFSIYFCLNCKGPFLEASAPLMGLQFHGAWRAPREIAQQDRQRHLEFLHESSEQIWKDRSTGQVHMCLEIIHIVRLVIKLYKNNS